MTVNPIAIHRLQTQQIVNSRFSTPKELVSYMGAMQAQDFEMSKWAVGTRLSDVTAEHVQRALDKGEILRTHLLRPTWHLLAAEDIYWMLELSAKRIKAQMTARNKELGLTPEVYKRSNKAIEKALSKGEHLTRSDLKAVLEKAGISTNENRLSHLLMEAELDKVICSGAIQGKNQTYALLEARVPKKIILSKEEALAKLTLKYFTSHCPATLQDFMWWSGLAAADARAALEAVKDELTAEEFDGQRYWYGQDFKPKAQEEDAVYLLPAFDEYLISYKDRSAMMTPTGHGKVFSSNGIFWPTIVINGKVQGLWKRKVEKESVSVTPNLFNKAGKKVLKQIEQEVLRFGKFLGISTLFKTGA